MRRAARIALPVLLLGVGAVPALAADQTVRAISSSFSPGTVALKPGETLTIRHEDGLTMHDLQFDDEPARRQEAGIGWTVQRTFGAHEAREPPYGFFCSLHPGMRGRVYVNESGTIPSAPSPSPSPAPTATPSPTLAPVSEPEPAQLRSIGLARRSVCARCRVRLRIDLSAPAEVRGTLRRRAPGARRFRRFGAVRFGVVPAGPRTLAFRRTASGRRLQPGRYRLAVMSRTLAFRVRGAR